jgi:hypothetical protein
MNQHTQLANLMSEFICSTICGFESGLYKSLITSGENINKIKTNQMTVILVNFNMNYYNQAYSSLIKKNDQYIVEKFGQMHKIMNHSYICLLNIMFRLTTEMLTIYDRNLLNITSYENYMKSVQAILNKCNEFLIEELPKMISHTCSGIDISTCNPDEPLFYIK